MILNIRGRGPAEQRSFALTDMVNWGYGALRGAGSPVTEAQARGVPALYRAARLRAEAVAGLRLCIWRGDGPQRQRVDGDWRARLFSRAPNDDQTRFGFWETVGESLAWRNKAFIWKSTDPQTGQILELYALHPDQVAIDGPDRFRVTVRGGYVDPVGKGNGVYRVGSDTVLFVRGHGAGGTLDPPTPIQVFKEALEGPIQRQRHEGRIWRNGASLQVAVVFPQGVSKEQADEWKPAWREAYTGTGGETTPMIGGGADIKPIGMSQADAAFVDMAKLTVHDASRIMGVPANLLGAQTERPVPNLEQDLAMWLRFGLSPELVRIEDALAADPQLFGSARLLYPMFDTEGFVRGDVQTEDNIAHQRVQDGRLLPDEWRAGQGLPPLPNGVGMIPQIVPVGGAPNPNNGTAAVSANGDGGSYD